ncbi:MAG: hypothetical protein V4755_14635, partial [Curtobacterium sp.]
LQCERRNLRRLLGARLVTAATASRVDVLYERLWRGPGADRCASAAAQRARRFAASHGWAPPMAWDDIDHDAAPASPVRLDDASAAARGA